MSSQGSPLGNLVVRVEGDSSPLEESLHKMEGSVASFVEHVGAATAGLAAAFGIALLGEQAFEAAEKFEKATFTIQRATGATGDKLEGLEETFKKVYATTGQSADAVAGALAQLSIRTGLVGEELEKLTTTNLHLTKVMGGDLKSNIEQTQKLFTQWGVTVDEQPLKLDELTVASQKTGVNFQTLTGEMTTAGPVLRNLGFNFEQSAALLAKFDQSGLGTQRIIASLGQTLSVLSQRFKDPEVELRNLLTRMQAAPGPMQALQLAMADGVGKKGALFLADAVKLGAFSIDELVKQMQEGKGTVDDLADKTKSLGDRWKVFQHVLEEALLPLGKPLIIALTDGADKAKAFVKEIQAGVDWFEKLPGPVKVATAALVALPIVVELGVKAFEKLVALKVVAWAQSLLPMIGNIATAIKLDMVGALTSGELWLLRFGQAGLVAASAFAGWKLGEWLRENIPLMQKFGDAIGDWILKVPGVTRLIDMLNGVDGANKNLAQSTEQLNQKLQAHGIILQRVVGESIESWNTKVHEAAVQAGLFAGAVETKQIPSLTSLQRSIDELNQKLLTHGIVLKQLAGETLQAYEARLMQAFAAVNRLGGAHVKLTRTFTDMKTELDKLRIAEFKHAVDLTGKSVLAMAEAHQAWGKKMEYVTDTGKLTNDMLGFENQAMLDLVSSSQNVAAVPLPEWFNSVTSGVMTSDQAFGILNVTTDKTRQAQLKLISEAYDLIKLMYTFGEVSQITMDKATEAMNTAVGKLNGTYEVAATKMAKTSRDLGQQILKVIGTDLSKAIGDIIFQTGKIGDAFVKLGKDVVDIVINHIIGAALKPLLKSLDEVLAKIPGLGSVFGGASSAGGSAAGGAASAAGGAASSGASGASGVAGGLMGGILGWANLGVSVLSGIVQGVEGARTNNLLGEIEVSTRYAWLALGSGDTSIAGWTHQTVMALSGMQQTLWEMRGDNGQIIDNLQQILQQIKSVAKLSTSVASGSNASTVNFHPGSIVVQGADDPHAVAESVARAIPRIMKARSSAFITQPAF